MPSDWQNNYAITFALSLTLGLSFYWIWSPTSLLGDQSTVQQSLMLRANREYSCFFAILLLIVYGQHPLNIQQIITNNSIKNKYNNWTEFKCRFTKLEIRVVGFFTMYRKKLRIICYTVSKTNDNLFKHNIIFNI